MSPSIEQDIKGQFAKYFETNDWRTFKKAGEYYLENAARIVTNDIRYEVKPFKLLRRNTQKRLYIGIAWGRKRGTFMQSVLHRSLGMGGSSGTRIGSERPLSE
jgi:hypothetical protein